VRRVAQESKDVRRFSTRFESASRKLVMPGERQGLKTNLAEAEGLQLPSPWEVHPNTKAGFATGCFDFVLLGQRFFRHPFVERYGDAPSSPLRRTMSGCCGV